MAPSSWKVKSCVAAKKVLLAGHQGIEFPLNPPANPQHLLYCCLSMLF